MPLDPASRCPGSGLPMVRRTFELRRIEGTDRQESDRRIPEADAHDDLEWAAPPRSRPAARALRVRGTDLGDGRTLAPEIPAGNAAVSCADRAGPMMRCV